MVLTRGSAVAVLAVAMFLGFAPAATADGDPEPPALSATLQDLPSSRGRYSVVWQGRTVSALPFRLRLLNQASPLAYSLDIRRQPAYGDSWTAISLGRPLDAEDRNLSQIGIASPVRAQQIALGLTEQRRTPTPASRPLEFAARQVAIWALTNGLPLDARTVPDADLRRRALQLRLPPDLSVPLQSATHQVSIFIRETTPNTVRLAVTVTVDANTYPNTSQTIDLNLDGVPCQIHTGIKTRILAIHDEGCTSDPPQPVPGAKTAPIQVAPGARTGVADVEMQRNTKVVDVSAVWAGVQTDPGLFLVSSGAAPPVVTGETVLLNYRSTTRLDPANYTGPRELLDKAGTGILTKIPTVAIWPLLILALYLLPRLGRGLDIVLKAIFAPLIARLKAAARRWWPWHRKAPPPADPAVTTAVSPRVLDVTAPTIKDAINAGRLATSADERLDIEVLQTPRRHVLWGSRPAKIRLTRQSSRSTRIAQ